MKKLFAFFMTICLLVIVLSVTSVTASAADLVPSVVLRISAITTNGTVVVGDYTDFEDGWNAAMRYANDREDYNYERIVVDLYSDWLGDFYFTEDSINGPGFDNNTIYFNDDVRMTLNMNGHTIDRSLGFYLRNGEVMYIDADADVIINNGTITGGGSYNGAGGIHINSGAKVTLNNVNVVGNHVDEDDGGGIALYNGASLIMNGGSLKDNSIRNSGSYGGAIYASESTVILNDVTIENNQTRLAHCYGAAIYADESTVLLNRCTLKNNGVADEEVEALDAISIIHAEDSSITIQNSEFSYNGMIYCYSKGISATPIYTDVSSLIYLEKSTLTMEDNTFTKNNTAYLIESRDDSSLYISETNFLNNTGIVLSSREHTEDSYFNLCKFNYNGSSDYLIQKYYILKYTFSVADLLTFYDCDMGNSVFSEDNDNFVFSNSEPPKEEAAVGVKLLLADGTVAFEKYFKDFASSWEYVELNAEVNTYTRIVVEFLSDWDTSKYSEGAVNVPSNSRITLNMNGHTINRGLKAENDNGEVICVYSDADLIINDGTISGGYSDNGAGGIHIKDDAIVTLNNVNITGNQVINDDGAGIAVYDGAILIMNGGSVSNNTAHQGVTLTPVFGAGIYVEDGTVSLNGVTLQNNQFASTFSGIDIFGVAMFSIDSNVTIKECIVKGNGITVEGADQNAQSIIFAQRTNMVIENTDFIGNGRKDVRKTGLKHPEGNSVVHAIDADITLVGGKFTDNNEVFLVLLHESVANAQGVDFTGNESYPLYVYEAAKGVSTFTDCKFSTGTPYGCFTNDFCFNDEVANVTFVNCDFDKSTFSNKNAVKFIGGNVSNNVGSIFGEGSLTMIVSFVALIASIASLTVNLNNNKNKSKPENADEEN